MRYNYNFNEIGLYRLGSLYIPKIIDKNYPELYNSKQVYCNTSKDGNILIKLNKTSVTDMLCICNDNSNGSGGKRILCAEFIRLCKISIDNTIILKFTKYEENGNIYFQTDPLFYNIKVQENNFIRVPQSHNLLNMLNCYVQVELNVINENSNIVYCKLINGANPKLTINNKDIKIPKSKIKNFIITTNMIKKDYFNITGSFKLPINYKLKQKNYMFPIYQQSLNSIEFILELEDIVNLEDFYKNIFNNHIEVTPIQEEVIEQESNTSVYEKVIEQENNNISKDVCEKVEDNISCCSENDIETFIVKLFGSSFEVSRCKKCYEFFGLNLTQINN